MISEGTKSALFLLIVGLKYGIIIIRLSEKKELSYEIQQYHKRDFYFPS